MRPGVRQPDSVRSEAALAAAIAAVASGLLIAFVPPAGDAAGHYHRLELVGEGALLWDNLWYGGFYPFLTYSLLYYHPAALLGNQLVTALSAVLAAALFAAVAIREWGPAAGWPSRLFAVAATGSLITGTYPYAVGLAALLATLRALQGQRPWLALGLAAITLALSPLAFAFLLIVASALYLSGRRLRRRGGAVALGFAALVAVQVSGALLLPSDQLYRLAAPQLAVALAAAALGAFLAYRAGRESGRRDVLVAVFGLWGLACLACYLVPNPVGVAVTRPRYLLLPLLLLVAVVARFRPRPVALAAIGLAVAYGVLPYEDRIRSAIAARSDSAAFWAPAVDFLRERSGPIFRVEVVPTGAHWEAHYLPRAGIALARGWYRQTDEGQHELFYSDPLAAPEYRAWLRASGVRYVLLPNLGLDSSGATAEAELLRSGRSGLRRVRVTPDFTFYELRRPTPLLTGPGRAAVTALEADRIEGRVARPGTYRLRVNHTPFWEVRDGELEVERGDDGEVRLRVSRPGRFVLVAAL